MLFFAKISHSRKIYRGEKKKKKQDDKHIWQELIRPGTNNVTYQICYEAKVLIVRYMSVTEAS